MNGDNNDLEEISATCPSCETDSVFYPLGVQDYGSHMPPTKIYHCSNCGTTLPEITIRRS